MKIGPKGLELIKSYEKLRLTAYNTDGAGVWTIGWGHTGKVDGKPVARGMKISRAKADQLFKSDLRWAEAAVNRGLRIEVAQEQFDAMVSLCFNIGAAGFARSSVLRFTNRGQFDKAARSFALWNKAKGRVLAGLIRRRAEEAALYAEAQDSLLLAEAEGFPVEEDEGKPMWKSRTALAGVTQVGTGAAMLSGAVAETKGNLEVVGFNYLWLLYALGAVVLVGGAWVIYDRYIKKRDYGA